MVKSRLDRLHGDHGKWGRGRWCKGCMKWVRLKDWKDHEPHYGLNKAELQKKYDD